MSNLERAYHAAHGMCIDFARWNPDAKYEFGFACAYYFSGKRNVTRKGEIVTIPEDPEKQTALFRKTLGSFARHTRARYPFLIIDDGSPVKVDADVISDLVAPNPLMLVRFDKNRGIGAGRNLIQHVLSERCKYVVRFDADVYFENFTFDRVREGFKLHDDCCGVTPCITYFARLHASQLPADQRWFAGANCADLIAWSAKDLRAFGYADPVLRWNVDADQRLRALAIIGKRIYVDRWFTGKAPPSGGGGDHDERMVWGRYIDNSRPFIKVIFPKNRGTPRLTLDKKNLNKAQGHFIGPDEMATYAAKVAWNLKTGGKTMAKKKRKAQRVAKNDPPPPPETGNGNDGNGKDGNDGDDHAKITSRSQWAAFDHAYKFACKEGKEEWMKTDKTCSALSARALVRHGFAEIENQERETKRGKKRVDIMIRLTEAGHEAVQKGPPEKLAQKMRDNPPKNAPDGVEFTWDE